MMLDFNHSSAAAQTFGETERRLVICIHFTVALALRVGTIGDGDVLVKFFYKFLSYGESKCTFVPRDMCIVTGAVFEPRQFSTH